jgi:hypothetical protein
MIDFYRNVRILEKIYKLKGNNIRAQSLYFKCDLENFKSAL